MLDFIFLPRHSLNFYLWHKRFFSSRTEGAKRYKLFGISFFPSIFSLFLLFCLLSSQKPSENVSAHKNDEVLQQSNFFIAWYFRVVNLNIWAPRYTHIYMCRLELGDRLALGNSVCTNINKNQSQTFPNLLTRIFCCCCCLWLIWVWADITINDPNAIF